jgi:hypothetical protein
MHFKFQIWTEYIACPININLLKIENVAKFQIGLL